MRTLVRNGRVATGGRLESLDLLIEDSRIAALGQFQGVRVDREIDATGHFVLPGFIDFHTHIADRIGRFELADGYGSGTGIAARKGITTVCTFVTQGSGETLPDALRRAQGKAAGACHADEKKVKINGKTLTLEVGRLAQQANAAVLGRLGDTIILATVCSSKPREDLTYFPLSVEYIERLYACGRISSSRFIKREGRPTETAYSDWTISRQVNCPSFPKDFFATKLKLLLRFFLWTTKTIQTF